MHGAGKVLAIDRQRRPAGYARGVGRLENERAEDAHFGLEQAVRVRRLRALECVRADELREPIGLVRRRRSRRPHLMHDDIVAALRELPRRLAAGESSTDDPYRFSHQKPAASLVGRRWDALFDRCAM